MDAGILGALLDVPPPSVDAREAEHLARDLFGVTGAATSLSGERDRNFRVRTGEGGEWVLKVVHPAEDPLVTDLQSVVLRHLEERAPWLPVPRVRPSLQDGAPCATWSGPAGGAELRVRMYSYLPGHPMALTGPRPGLAANVGRLVADLDLALTDVRHPGDEQDLAWDAHRVARVAPLLEDLPGPERDTTGRALKHFLSHAGPRLAGLRTQIIHNDVNLHNALTAEVGDPQISAIIDFGDLVRAPLVQDVTTAAAYQVRPTGHPMDGPVEVIAAFHQRVPLTAQEIDLVLDFLTARWILTVSVTGWRARQQPANRDYILRNSAQARSALHRMQAVGCHEAAAIVRSAITSEGPR